MQHVVPPWKQQAWNRSRTPGRLAQVPHLARKMVRVLRVPAPGFRNSVEMTLRDR